MEENEEKKVEQQQTDDGMSKFCEMLMGVTQAVAEMNINTPDDLAIVICADGTNLACRKLGTPMDLANILVVEMVDDPIFAEMILMAALYTPNRSLPVSRVRSSTLTKKRIDFINPFKFK